MGLMQQGKQIKPTCLAFVNQGTYHKHCPFTHVRCEKGIYKGEFRDGINEEFVNKAPVGIISFTGKSTISQF